jgi:hypothetical protein
VPGIEIVLSQYANVADAHDAFIRIAEGAY